MDINVRVTFDASDKLVHLIHELASAVSHRTAYDSSAVPESASKSEPAPKSDPAPEPKLYGVYAMAESLASKPENAPKSGPTTAYNLSATPELVPTTAYKMSAVPEPTPKPAPTPESAPKPEPTPDPAPTPEPATAQNAEQAKALTIDDVRRVCLRATKAGKTKVVTDFLDAQGVKNLPALDPSLYDALVTVVEDNL